MGTVTLGDSGDSFTIPAGVTITNNGTQTGFGRTGTVNWQTGSIKTGNFTATNGEGYFVNTSSGAVTVTLPSSPSAGNIVAVADYAGTSATNNITIARNSSPFEGGTNDGTIATNRQAATLVYVDGTQGWIVVNSNDASFIAPEYVTATGGTITTVCTNFKVHTFTGPGTFEVTNAGNAVGSNTVDYLVVAGGGAGGYANGGGGGGGAGGLRYSATTYCNPAPGPSAAPAALPVSVTSYPITVGAGGGAKSGSPDYKRGDQGSTSTFSSISSAGGGGGGGGHCGSNGTGGTGGSGGGGGKGDTNCAQAGGAGNTPPVAPPQGGTGGTGGASNNPVGNPNHGGGGGGAGACGGNAGPGLNGGDGGNGLVVKINGSCSAYAGGGGGQSEGQPAPAQGSGGSGGGGSSAQTGSNGNAGSANTGGGGGGVDSVPSGRQSGAGGSGIVIIRYKFQN